MGTRHNERYPIVEKSIPIDPEEYTRLRRAFTINDRVKGHILDLLIEASTKIQDREGAVFDELATRFGFANTQEAQVAGKMVEISWATRQINLRVKSGGGEGAGPVPAPSENM